MSNERSGILGPGLALTVGLVLASVIASWALVRVCVTSEAARRRIHKVFTGLESNCAS